MGQHQPFFIERPFELCAVDAGLRRDGEGRLIDFDNLIEPLGVQDDAAEDRERTPLRTRAASPGNDGDPVGVGDFQDGRNLLCRAGMDDIIRRAWRFAPVEPHLGQPEPVGGIDEPVGLAGRDIGLPDDLLKLAANHFALKARPFHSAEPDVEKTSARQYARRTRKNQPPDKTFTGQNIFCCPREYCWAKVFTEYEA